MKAEFIEGIYNATKNENGDVLFTMIKEKEVIPEPINVPAETIKPYETKEEVVVDPILEQLGLDDADAKDVVESKEEPENEPEDEDEDDNEDDNDESDTELVPCTIMITKGMHEYFYDVTQEAKKQAKIVPPPTKLKKQVFLGELVAEKFNTQALEHFRLKSKANV